MIVFSIISRQMRLHNNITSIQRMRLKKYRDKKLYTIEINIYFTYFRDILAVGDVRANVEIWKFPRHLF